MLVQVDRKSCLPALLTSVVTVKTGSIGVKGVLREQVRKQTDPLETDEHKPEENRKRRWGDGGRFTVISWVESKCVFVCVALYARGSGRCAARRSFLFTFCHSIPGGNENEKRKSVQMGVGSTESDAAGQ